MVGDRAISGSAASASQIGRFETPWLGRSEKLADLAGQWIDKVHQRRSPRIVVLDLDSSEGPTYGEQEGSSYNGHFGCTCYHPLFVFKQLGDVEQRVLRSGNVHSAEGWRAVLEPVVARYRGTVKRLYFRGDAAFANPEMYEFLEADGAGYTIRLPANSVLQNRIGYLLKRPVGQDASIPRKTRAAVAKMIPSAARARSPRVGSRGAGAQTFSRRQLIEITARPLAPHPGHLTRATSSIASARCLWNWARPSISRTPYGEKSPRRSDDALLAPLAFRQPHPQQLGRLDLQHRRLAMISSPRIARALL